MVGRKVRIERVPFHEYPAALQQCFPLRFETAAERRRDDSAYLWVHFGQRGNHVVLREMGPQLSFLRPFGRLARRCYSLPIGSGATALRRSSNHCTALRTVFQLVAQKSLSMAAPRWSGSAIRLASEPSRGAHLRTKRGCTGWPLFCWSGIHGVGEQNRWPLSEPGRGISHIYIYPAVERFEPKKSPVAARPRIVPSGGSLGQRSVA